MLGIILETLDIVVGLNKGFEFLGTIHLLWLSTLLPSLEQLGSDTSAFSSTADVTHGVSPLFGVFDGDSTDFWLKAWYGSASGSKGI